MRAVAMSLMFLLGATAAVRALAAPSHEIQVGQATRSTDPTETILARFAADYEKDPSLRDVTFAVVIDHDNWWHIVASRGTPDGPASVRVVPGPPPEPTIMFSLDRQTLERLDSGAINPLTAIVRGFASDPAAMSTRVMPGFDGGADTGELILDLTFHFWTRGWPEIVPFDEGRTRFVHGTDAVVLFYQPGFRSGWFSMKPGQHANEDIRLRVNPFPTLIVVTKGQGRGRIGGQELELAEGNAVLIPAGVEHEFWNPTDGNVEGLILMFGKGA